MIDIFILYVFSSDTIEVLMLVLLFKSFTFKNVVILVYNNFVDVYFREKKYFFVVTVPCFISMFVLKDKKIKFIQHSTPENNFYVFNKNDKYRTRETKIKHPCSLKISVTTPL